MPTSHLIQLYHTKYYKCSHEKALPQLAEILLELSCLAKDIFSHMNRFSLLDGEISFVNSGARDKVLLFFTQACWANCSHLSRQGNNTSTEQASR